MLNELELTGRARTHVVQRDDLGAALHAAALDAFLDLKADAARAGIDLAITIGFRDFSAQQRIWDLKYRGERPLYDSAGIERDHSALDPEALVELVDRPETGETAETAETSKRSRTTEEQPAA